MDLTDTAICQGIDLRLQLVWFAAQPTKSVYVQDPLQVSELMLDAQADRADDKHTPSVQSDGHPDVWVVSVARSRDPGTVPTCFLAQRRANPTGVPGK